MDGDHLKSIILITAMPLIKIGVGSTAAYVASVEEEQQDWLVAKVGKMKAIGKHTLAKHEIRNFGEAGRLIASFSRQGTQEEKDGNLGDSKPPEKPPCSLHTPLC